MTSVDRLMTSSNFVLFNQVLIGRKGVKNRAFPTSQVCHERIISAIMYIFILPSYLKTV